MLHGTSFPYVREIVIFLGIAAILVPLFHRFRVSPVLGFLLAGLLIGPHGLGSFTAEWRWLHYVTYDEVESVGTIAEFGIVLLLFVIGLEMSFERLWAMRRLVLGLGPAQVLITAVVIGLLAWGWGNAPAVAVIIGTSLALSSTAVVMEELFQRAEFATPAGRATFSVLLFQDISVVPLLIVVSSIAAAGDASFGVALAISVGTALGAAAALWLLGRSVLRPLFHLAAGERAPEFFVAITLLTAIAAASATSAAGMSPALGAFLAGMLLADTEFRHQIEADIQPFKGLLMGLFFISVGMSIDIRAVAELAFWVAASVAGLVLIKATIATVLGRLFDLPLPVAVQMGLLLGEGGEFALVAVSMALGLGVMPVDTAQFILLVTALSMLLTPALAALGRRAAAWLERRAPPRGPVPQIGADLSDHVVIAGYGRVGQAVAALLVEERIPFVALDLDLLLVARCRTRDEPVFFGDARRAEVLMHLGTDRARAIVLTVGQQTAAERLVRLIRRRCPALDIYARAKDRRHARRLEAAGATRTVPEMTESSLQMGAVVLSGLGVPSDVVSTLVERVREEGYEGL